MNRYCVRIQSAEVDIKIVSAIVNVKTLEDSELVARRGRGSVWKAVLD